MPAEGCLLLFRKTSTWCGVQSSTRDLAAGGIDRSIVSLVKTWSQTSYKATAADSLVSSPCQRNNRSAALDLSRAAAVRNSSSNCVAGIETTSHCNRCILSTSNLVPDCA